MRRVVFGILKKDGSIDKKRCGELVVLAYPLGVTFHRAFDRTNDPFKALDDIIDIGCERILSSGLQPNAVEGIPVIRELVAAADDKIIIMPGSGVNSKNIVSLAKSTGAVEFHSSASMHIPGKMGYENSAMNDTMKYIMVNEDEVKKMVQSLKEIIDWKMLQAP